MPSPLMPTFRLVGAQILTAKAEMSKSRPKGSPKLTDAQKASRTEAQRQYGEAVQIYTAIEQRSVMGSVELDTPENRQDLWGASVKAYNAQREWRKAHPSEAVEIKVVSI